MIKNEFHPERSSISAYVVFKTSDNAKAALEANGTVFHDHHLRVDIAKNAEKQVDPKKSVFLGNVPFGKYFRTFTSHMIQLQSITHCFFML